MTDTASREAVARRIAKREKVDQSEIVPFLMAPANADRQVANLRFAEAYLAAGDWQMAHSLGRRAFDIGPFNVEVFNFLYNLLLTHNRLEELVDVVRESIVMAAEARETGIVYELFASFNGFIGRWPSLATLKPEPHADRLISWAMEVTFGSRGPALAADVLSGRKIRVGVMLAGDSVEESALVRAALGFLKHHDRSRFEVFVYSYLTADTLHQANAKYASWVKDFESWGCTFRYGMPGIGLPKVLATHKMLELDRLDVLVFNLLVGDYHVLALLRPAAVVVGAIHGNPKGYSMRHLDGTLATDTHSQMESLATSIFLRSAIDFQSLMPPASEGKPLTRAALGIADDAIIVMTAGRDYKFSNPELWRSVERVLRSRPNTVWMMCGVEADYPKKANIAILPDVAAHIRYVPWRADFVWNVLPLADIVVDTFPAGGAFIIFWAMRIAKPCVSFRSNYLRQFHQLDWSPAFRVVGREDLALPHGDADALVRRVERLIDNGAQRAEFGATCQEIVATLDDHARFAADVGEALIEFIRRKQAQAKTPGS